MRLQRSNSEKQEIMKKVVYQKVGNKQLRVKEGSIFEVIKETPKTLKLKDENGKEHTFTNCKEFFTEVK